MKQPMDPASNSTFDGPSEFCWGTGMFPPGIANNEGSTDSQDDFGLNMVPPTKGVGSINDNYARAVADRRTDVTDPNSDRSFSDLGNTDRYGAAPPLVRSKPQPNVSQRQNPPEDTFSPRKW